MLWSKTAARGSERKLIKVMNVSRNLDTSRTPRIEYLDDLVGGLISDLNMNQVLIGGML